MISGCEDSQTSADVSNVAWVSTAFLFVFTRDSLKMTGFLTICCLFCAPRCESKWHFLNAALLYQYLHERLKGAFNFPTRLVVRVVLVPLPCWTFSTRMSKLRKRP
jgi:hypothetical protein